MCLCVRVRVRVRVRLCACARAADLVLHGRCSLQDFERRRDKHPWLLHHDLSDDENVCRVERRRGRNGMSAISGRREMLREPGARVCLLCDSFFFFA